MGIPEIKIKPQHKPSQVQEVYQNSKNPTEQKRAHFIWLLLEGNHIQEVEEIVDYSHVQAIKIIKKYNQYGLEGLKDKRKTNQGRPPILDDTQIFLLAQIIRHDFNNEIIWDAKKVKKYIETTTSKTIHLSNVYEYISLIGFSFQKPRPQHVENLQSILEEFQKKLYQMPYGKLEKKILM